MRVLWYFASRIAGTNLLLSLLLVVVMQGARSLSSGRLPGPGSALVQLAAVGLTAGFVLSGWTYCVFRRHEWPLYRNHGYRPSVCFLAAYAFDVVVGLLLVALGFALGAGGTA